MIVEDYIEPGLSLLPDQFDLPAARAMLIAIGLQESRFRYRTQIGGPARGYWQFEMAGIVGVMYHNATKTILTDLCEKLHLPYNATVHYGLVAYYDALACVYARLLLWSLPHHLPGPEEFDAAWQQYLDTWRPGRPHQETWNEFYRQAWEMVLA